MKCNAMNGVLVTCRNLSSLNLGGEISPSIGDLRNLQSMYAPFYFLTKPFYYVPNVVVIDFFFFCGVGRDFQGNKLTGQIPDEIGNCGSLVHM